MNKKKLSEAALNVLGACLSAPQGKINWMAQGWATTTVRGIKRRGLADIDGGELAITEAGRQAFALGYTYTHAAIKRPCTRDPVCNCGFGRRED